ncbi:glycosyltransferase [Bradyrhizobium retamae]|uniref:Uncharacterized protein n=1 Tax=Bradyrhizobium retamae TaxID=1300035 RepID=A0A0R3N559_9BRAD|nr:glycosyltransferase [Bradyrhizobium retamae]KRR27609.1 hypothetical protein CQ13_04280 [Bradyrhizobium retamae]
MALTILHIAYPFAPVGPDSVGGAEQILYRLDEALERSGHRSIVIACEGSRPVGIHVSVSRATGSLHRAEIEAAQRHHRDAIAVALGRWPVDIIHLHGVDL